MEICRAITFINYHIPIQNINEEEMEYSAIGFFDGMKTESIPISIKENDFKSLWEHTMYNMKKEEGHYSYQNIFVFGDDDWNQYSDEIFWEKEQNKKTPLTFIVYLQLQKYEIGKDAIMQRCKELNRVAKEELKDDGIVYSYYTIDKNDFVVCLKCLHYRKAVETIKALHSINQTVIYSYSIFTISNDVLNEMTQQKYPIIFEQTLDSICLKGITNSMRSENSTTLDSKYKTLCSKLVKELYGTSVEDHELYDILGDNDFRFIARKVNLGKLLLQLSKNGLLCYSERTLQYYLFSSNLVINCKTLNFKGDGAGIISDDRNINLYSPQCSPKCDQLLHTLKKIISRNLDCYSFAGKEEVASYLYAIWQLLQSLKAMEIAPTKKYDFLSLFYPLSMLISILEEKREITNNNVLHEFIHKISMTLHGTLRTDIQFFQIKDFNVIVHYAPAKLRAFYSLWAIRVQDFYNDLFIGTGQNGEQREEAEHQYSFVFSPGMFKEVSVKQLYEDYDEPKKLMLITSPERYLYLLNCTPVILAHEVSHFVGSQVRSRGQRHKIWIRCCARVLALELESFRYRSIERDTTGYALNNCLERAIAQTTIYDELVNQLEEDETFVSGVGLKLEHPYHSLNSKKIILNTFSKTIHTDIERIISVDSGNLQNKMKKDLDFDDLAFEDRIKVAKYLQDLTYGRDRREFIFATRFHTEALSQIFDVFKYLTVECHADLMAVLTLELLPERYLRSFSDSSILTNIEELKDTPNRTLIVRMSLVIETVRAIVEKEKDFFKDSEFVKMWTGEVTKNLAEKMSIDEMAGILSVYVYAYTESSKTTNMIEKISGYNEIYNRKSRSFINRELGFLNDSVIWKLLNSYLLTCADEYVKIMKNKKVASEKQKKLKNTFREITENSILRAVQEIENFLADFGKT